MVSPGLCSIAIWGTSAPSISAGGGRAGPSHADGWPTCAPPMKPGDLTSISSMDRTTLGDYRIEGVVGAGRMGVVYLAVDRATGRKVALKVLRNDFGLDPEYRERFRREGSL